jgi:hypothetical protein
MAVVVVLVRERELEQDMVVELVPVLVLDMELVE